MSTQQMLEDMRKQRQMEDYRRNQRRFNIANTLDTIGNKLPSLPNAINKTRNAINKTRNAITFGSNIVKGLKTGETLGNAIKGAQAINNAAKVANTASTVGNAANTAGTLGNASTALSSAGPALGAVGGTLSAGANIAKKDYASAGMDAAATAAALAGGPVGWGVYAAMQVGKMIKSAMDKKKQKALAKSQEQLNETMQQAADKKQDNMSQFDNDALASNTMSNQSMLAAPTNPVNTQAGQIMQEQLQTGLNEAPTSSNEIEDTLEGTPTGAAANINQGYMGALPELGVENSTPSWGQNVLDAINNIPQEQQPMASANAPSLADSISQEVNNQPVQDNSISQIMDKYVQAKEPKSRKQEIIDSMMSKFRGGLGDLVEGYRDNAYTSFSEGDLARGMAGQPTGAAASAEPKSFMNRLGEAIGTGSRVISNPGVQGLVAGAIKGANTDDWGAGLEYGVNWAANKAKSDSYYKKMNPNAKRNPIFSNYDSKDYNAHTLEGYRAANVNKNMQTAESLANAMLGSGRWSEQEAQDFINANGADAQIPVQLFNYLLKDNQAAEKITADMNKHQDNFGEKVRHNKASEEIGRTNAGANVTRAGAYAASKTEDDTDYSSSESVDSNVTVRVMGPDGKIRRIPENRLEEAIAAGGRRI